MQIKEIFQLVPEAAEQLPRGAFLTAGGGVWNPMTIGWAQFGVVWSKPVMTVLVRKSRYTYGLMEQADVFTVSVPRAKELSKELGFCGSRSGRDVDKEKESGVTRAPPSRQEKGPLLYSSRGPDFHAADFIVVCQLYGAVAVTRQVFPFPANCPAPEVRNVCRIKDVSTSERCTVLIEEYQGK